MPSLRRIKQVRLLSTFTFVLVFMWFLLCRYLGLYELSQWMITMAMLFLVVQFLAQYDRFTASRVLYIAALNIGVTVTASFVGQPGNVEFMLLFATGLPFLMFSFRRERLIVIISSLLPLVEWVALVVTDFNLITESKINPEVAAHAVYPVSLVSTFLLVGFQTSYFAFLNAGYYTRIQNKRIEAEEASSAKSRFLSTMSHEIRTPLNAVIGLSHILRENDPREDQIDNLDALNFSGKLLLQLLNNVLDYSKMETQEFVLDPIPTDLNLAFRQLHKMHEPNCIKKGISIDVEIDEDIPLVWLDVVRFNQVLNNLINNAIKFTEEGGVTVWLKKLHQSDEDVNLCVKVSDTGIGIAEDKQDEVFEAFKQEDTSTQRKYGGTGLGLSIAKEIVERMGGKISLESKPGEGSIFRFELILKRVSDQETKSLDKEATYDLNGVRVLLVEDNVINELVGRQILEKEGVVLDSATNGQEAVDMVREHTYDVVLMDIQMPVMDGYVASRTIREFNPDIPILALSASVFMEVKDKIMQAGMNGFIIKPFEPQNLFEEIVRAISKEEEATSE